MRFAGFNVAKHVNVSAEFHPAYPVVLSSIVVSLASSEQRSSKSSGLARISIALLSLVNTYARGLIAPRTPTRSRNYRNTCRAKGAST